jgi:hypothetical protein
LSDKLRICHGQVALQGETTNVVQGSLPLRTIARMFESTCTPPTKVFRGFFLYQEQASEVQQAALNDLKDATAKALAALQSACPNELPNTPPGRLAAMRERIETMLKAVNLMQPALQRFYDSLSDEQKARFNAIKPERQPRGRPPSDLSQVCSGQAARATNVPTDRIVQALKPTDSQRSALNALNEATAKASDFLKANCTEDETLTPPGRVAAMGQQPCLRPSRSWSGRLRNSTDH